MSLCQQRKVFVNFRFYISHKCQRELQRQYWTWNLTRILAKSRGDHIRRPDSVRTHQHTHKTSYGGFLQYTCMLDAFMRSHIHTSDSVHFVRSCFFILILFSSLFFLFIFRSMFINQMWACVRWFCVRHGMSYGLGPWFDRKPVI